MKRIYKYRLLVTDLDEVRMPDGAQIIAADWQGPDPRMLNLWAIVDRDAPLVSRQFRVIGTGHPIPDLPDLKHVATVLQPVGLVWHIFEVVGQEFHGIRQAIAGTVIGS